MAVDINKVIKEAREQAERTATWLRTTVEDAIGSMEAEMEVRAAAPFDALQASGIIAKDVVLHSYSKPMPASSDVNATLNASGSNCFFASEPRDPDHGGSGQKSLGECVLKPGAYRVVVLFIARKP